MRVLVVEHEPHAAAGIIEGLAEAGHEAVTCHESGTEAFPCAGVTGPCPMEDGVDVTLVVRPPDAAQPSVYEDGATCSIQAHIPMVVAGGQPDENPFATWTVEFVDVDADAATAAVERAAVAPNEALSAVATAAAARSLAPNVPAPSAVVHSSRDGFKVIVEVDPVVPEDLSHRLAAWVLSAVRAELDTPKAIDVSVVRRRMGM